MLCDVNFKTHYTSDEDNIFTDFYAPGLSNATVYKRSVGYFSAAVLVTAGQAFSKFFENEGKIQLIVGAFVNSEDFDAIKAGYDIREIADKIDSSICEEMDLDQSDLFKCRLSTIAHLVRLNKMEIKVAIRKAGLFHPKVGIWEDDNDNVVVFTGSANETDSALDPEFNFETLNVFSSWDPGSEKYWRPHFEKFDQLWRNKIESTPVIDFPQIAHHKLKLISEQTKLPNFSTEQNLWELFSNGGGKTFHKQSNNPRVPVSLNGNKFSLRSHQLDALEKWKKNEFSGIMKLATGAGKTITAIYGATSIFQAKVRLFLIIAVPFKALADQWVDELKIFNINATKCYNSKAEWADRLNSKIKSFNLGLTDFEAIVVVNKTLKSQSFQSYLKLIPEDCVMFVGDECHHHSSKSFEAKIPVNARFKLGLSATPEHYLDNDRNEFLSNIYGEIVSVYSLGDAISDGVLTQYDYHIHRVDLTEDESARYVEVSKEIGRLFAQSGFDSKTENSGLEAKLRERSRIISNAEMKLFVLNRLLAEADRPIKHSLIYCGDGSYEISDGENDGDSLRQIEVVSQTMHRHGWRVSPFTASENTAERKEILSRFKDGFVDSLVAIRCLDEGIDIPACSTAYILASARDPRQFIQRRGRILRKSEGKTVAVIHDFLVNLPVEQDSNYGKRLAQAEMKRVAEFAGLALNYAQIKEDLRDYLALYGLERTI
jgi:superfamily II DNA or RNA helicase